MFLSGIFFSRSSMWLAISVVLATRLFKWEVM